MLGHDQFSFAPEQTLNQSSGTSGTGGQSTGLNQTLLVSVGGPGNDNFIFHSDLGADSITSFNPQADKIALDHYANAQIVQELQSLISTDPHGDAFINFAHNDGVTLMGVTSPHVQQAVLAGHVLLH